MVLAHTIGQTVIILQFQQSFPPPHYMLPKGFADHLLDSCIIVKWHQAMSRRSAKAIHSSAAAYSSSQQASMLCQEDSRYQTHLPSDLYSCPQQQYPHDTPKLLRVYSRTATWIQVREQPLLQQYLYHRL